MIDKVKSYYQHAKTLPLREVFKRAPFTLARETAEYSKNLRWRWLQPSPGEADIIAGINAFARFPYSDFAAIFIELSKNIKPADRVHIHELLSVADTLCRGEFDVLGSGAVHLGLPPCWHSDFKVDFTWPKSLCHFQVRKHTSPGADLKTPWELSRSEWLLQLGGAWRLTDNEQYSHTAKALLADFIKNNPTARGVNWICPMDIGMRAAAWCWGMAMLHDAPGFDEQMKRIVVESLWRHGAFIRDHLEYSPYLTSNHYLGDLVGLLHVGLIFRDTLHGANWLDFAWNELQREIEKQVWPDGGDAEASASYHRLVLEFFVISAILAKHHNLEINDSFLDRLHLMFQFVKGYLRPDGHAPQIGDNDSGRMFSFIPREINDHRYILTWGALLFEDESLKIPQTPLDLEAICLFGSSASDTWAQLPIGTPPSSALFPDFGVVTLRDWEPGDYCSFYAGDIGQRGNGGHAHNDKLSVEIMVAGRPFIVDPGTGCYTPQPEWRNRFRGTASHSTLQIGDEEQTPLTSGLFHLDGDPKAKILDFQTDASGGRVVGEHVGWRRLTPPLVHRREVTWDRHEKNWTITDRLIVDGPDDSSGAKATPPAPVKIHWILHPDVSVESGPEGEAILTYGQVKVRLESKPQCRWEQTSWWYSKEYGRWTDTIKIVFYPDWEDLLGDGCVSVINAISD